jgi:integrase
VSVYKPKKSPHWQYDFVYQSRRFYGSTGQTTKRRALEVEQAKRLAVAKGEADRPATAMTIDEAAQRYWEEHGQFKASAVDIEARLAIAVHLIGKNTQLAEINADRVAKAIQKRRGLLVRGKKMPTNATVNRDMIDTTLRPILRKARRVWKIPGVDDIEWKDLRLEEPAPHPRDFNSKDIASLHAALPSYWHDFARFEARYALRAGEMFFLPTAVDVEGRRLTIVRTVRKNKRAVTIPLLDEDVAMLAGRISRAQAAGLKTVWFKERKRGKLTALTYRAAIQAFRKAMTASGLRASHGARGTHDLRHHGGMQALRATGNLRTTQKLMGHASIQSTMVYAHALDSDVRAALEAVSRSGPEVAGSGVGEDEGNQRDAG